MHRDDARTAEVVRVLTRYLVEVVEAHDLCPWAAAARRGGELAITVVLGAPGGGELADAAVEMMARPEIRVGMLVLPELAVTPRELRALRDQVTARVGNCGVAEFYPEAPLDLETPARTVPFCRRSPDPLLQLVPLAVLDAIRGAAQPIDRVKQAAMLGGYSTQAPRVDVSDRIADANHATLTAHGDAVIATLAAIDADRAEAYARVGLVSPRRR